MEDQKRRQFALSILQTARAITGDPKLEVRYGDGLSSESEIVLPEMPEQMSADQENIMRGVADRAAFLRRYQPQNSLLKQQTQSMWHQLSALEAVRVEYDGSQDFPGAQKGLGFLNQQEALKRRQEGFVDTSYLVSLMLRDMLSMPLAQEQKNILKLYDDDISADMKAWVKEFTPYMQDESSRLTAYQEFLRILGVENKDQEDQQNPESEEDVPMQAAGEAIEEDQRTPEEIAGDVAPNPDLEDEAETEPTEGEDSGTSGARAKQKEQNAYKAFTTEFDKVTHATEMVTAQELKRLQVKFKNLRKGTKSLAAKLAAELQKHLLAPVRTGWQFEQEEGLLDPQKLTQIIVSSDPKPFRIPAQEQLKDTAVSILVDNSGSMRGKPIEMAAVSTDLLARTLERCGVPTEVLGFTTQTWKGGQSRLKWLGAGKPKPVGRLNDLLHIIYKAADEPQRKAEANFAAMLADDMLKENVDGESLLWAYRRLNTRQEERKILIVISDGAPVDYATDQHNTEGYLDAHLKNAIQAIEKQNQVDLMAIGIGHDVTQYYQNALVIKDPSELGPALVKRIVSLFA